MDVKILSVLRANVVSSSQMEGEKIIPVFDPELAMAGMTSIERDSDEAVVEKMSTSAGEGDPSLQPSQ